MSISVSPTQLMNSIPIEVGDIVSALWPSGIVTGNLPIIWGMFDDKSAIDVRLQYLYAKRKAIDYLKGAVRGKVRRHIDNTDVDYNALMTNLKDMQADVDQEIIAFEQSGAFNYPASVQMTTTAPIQPGDVIYLPNPNLPYDGNDPRIQGSVYLPPFATR